MLNLRVHESVSCQGEQNGGPGILMLGLGIYTELCGNGAAMDKACFSRSHEHLEQFVFLWKKRKAEVEDVGGGEGGGGRRLNVGCT